MHPVNYVLCTSSRKIKHCYSLCSFYCKHAFCFYSSSDWSYQPYIELDRFLSISHSHILPIFWLCCCLLSSHDVQDQFDIFTVDYWNFGLPKSNLSRYWAHLLQFIYFLHENVIFLKWKINFKSFDWLFEIW